MDAADSPEQILAEARWLERLAFGLVGDADAAGDLAQDAWVAAHAVRGPSISARRAWLTGTLRRLAARTLRSRARTRRRERLAARAEALPSMADLTARAELHERMVGLVRALPEHYRLPLLLRFYDDLPPRLIAERLGVPVRTVNTRLQRGLELLRVRLDSEHGSRRAWVGLLLLPPHPAVTPPATPPVQPLGVVRTWAVAAGVTAVALALGWVLLGERESRNDAPLAAVDQARDSTAVAAGSRGPSQPTRTPHPAPAAPSPGDTTWHGEVVDWHGQPIADAEVTVTEHLGLIFPDGEIDSFELVDGATTPVAAHTDRRGQFFGTQPVGPVVVRAQGEGFTTALAAIWRPQRNAPVRVVVAPAVDLDRAVLDAEGRPLAGVQVCTQIRGGLDLECAVASAHPQATHATTDDAGQMRLHGVAQTPATWLVFSRPGAAPHELPLAELPPRAIVLPADRNARTGRVVDERGVGVAGATVVAGAQHVRTDRDGAFTITLPPGTTLGVAAPGRAPLCVRGDCLTDDAARREPIALASPAQHLRGAVRDGAGRPVAGLDVWLADPTVVGTAERGVVLESLAAGGRGFYLVAPTDGEGRFVLEGLAARGYRLRVLDPRTAAWFTTAAFTPGVDVEITVPGDLLHATLRGQLCTPDGAPLVGAEVGVQGPGYGVRFPGATADTLLFAHGASASTAADGTFTLHDVPRQGAGLRVAHANTGLVTLDIPMPPPPRFCVSVPRCAELRVRLRQAHGGEQMQVLDGDGTALLLRRRGAVTEQSLHAVPLEQGRSPILAVPETGVVVRIATGTHEVLRVAVRLVPGELTTLDL